MEISLGWRTIAVAVLSSTVMLAHTSAQTATQPGKDKYEAQAMPITVVGCLQKESDYRKEHHIAQAAWGTGLGSADEFVLINAFRTDAAGAASMPANIDCSHQSVGEAYELTGPNEDHINREMVGKMVQISGMRKHAEVRAVGTSGTDDAKPTGGFDPLHSDLKLFEIEVGSSQAYVAPAPAAVASTTEPSATVAEATPAPAAVQPAPAPEPQPSAPAAAVETQQPTGTSGQASTPAPEPTTAAAPERQLPRTASPLPLTGLFGLFSFFGGVGLRFLRRR